MFIDFKKKISTGIILGMTAIFIAACTHNQDHRAENTKADTAPIVTAENKSKSEPNVVRIEIEKYTFSPAQITVSAGTKIIWKNKDKVAHTVTSSDKKFDSGLFGQDKEWSYTFDTPGEYSYFCIPHPNMTAKVMVKYF